MESNQVTVYVPLCICLVERDLSKGLFDKVVLLLYIVIYFTSVVGIEHCMWSQSELMDDDRKCITQFVIDISGWEFCFFL